MKISTTTRPAVMTIALSVFAAPASAMLLDQSFTSASTQSAQVGLTIDGLSQTFTVGLAGIFDSAELLLQHGNSTPTADLTVSLWSTTAGAPNALVTSIAFAPGDINSSVFSAVLVDFSAALLAVSVGDVLAVAISSPDTYQWSAGVDGFATYASGQRYTDSAGAPVAWSPLSNWDMSFKTYVDTGDTPVPAPATLALFGLGLAGLGWSRRKQQS